MKKRVLFASALVLSSTLLAAGGTAYAAIPTDGGPDSNPRIANVKGTVTFDTKENLPQKPTNPEDKDKEIENPNNKPTDQTGDLRIIYASNFEFGSHLDTTTGPLYAKLDGNSANSVQIEDKRAGAAKGWKLTAQRTEFNNGTDDLAGAVLTVLNTTATKNGDGTGTVPTTLAAKGGVVIPVIGEVVIAKTAVTPATTEGQGKWAIHYGSAKPSAAEDAEKSVKLDYTSVPSTGTYTSDIIYRLYNTPAV